jgi:inner membrane protein
LLGYYVGHVLHSFRRGAGFAALLSSLYAVLYVLLRAEDHALLAGSILVFTALAAAMVATRRVDWYALAANPPAMEAPAGRKPA